MLIPLPAGFISNLSGCCWINNSGQVAAVESDYSDHERPFLGTPTGSSAIPLPPSWEPFPPCAYLGGINSSSQVAGVGCSGTTLQAFIGSTAGTVAIPLPPGGSYAAPKPPAFPSGNLALNDSNVVIGQSDVGPWIWDSVNQTRLLSGLVPIGWKVFIPIAINNPGEILEVATSPQGVSEFVLLTPVAPPTTPAPATLGLTVTGLVLLALMVCRRSAKASAGAA